MTTPARRCLLALFGLGLLVPGDAPATAQRGDLCFPLEGWGIVARWRVGSGARSVREGWARRLYNDHGWARVKGGAPLPAAPSGIWLRTTFRYRRSSWTDAFINPAPLPPEARLFVNGLPVGWAPGAPPVWIGPLLRGGTNAVAVYLPAGGDGAGSAPALEVRGLGRASGKDLAVARLSAWRVRPEELAPALSPAWLKGAPGGDAPGQASTMPGADEAALPHAPVGIRAILDVPAYWRSRPLAVFLHEVPGAPAVYLNGRMLVDALHAPARVDLGHAFNFDGRDTLTLVWPDGPPAAAAAWGIASLHWSPAVAPPDLPSGSVVAWDPTVGANQPGADRALAYASQILAISATAYALEWTRSPTGPVLIAGTLVAAWSGTSFRGAEMAAAREAVSGRLAAARPPVWLMTPPTVGRSRNGTINGRLLEHDRALVALARTAGARPVPVFEVFNSALRRQRLWPARPEWSDGSGTLTPYGAYLIGLVIVDTLSLK